MFFIAVRHASFVSPDVRQQAVAKRAQLLDLHLEDVPDDLSMVGAGWAELYC